jgi:hypothetical protein
MLQIFFSEQQQLFNKPENTNISTDKTSLMLHIYIYIFFFPFEGRAGTRKKQKMLATFVNHLKSALFSKH